MITEQAKADFIKRLTDAEALWLTVYGEARGEHIEAQIAVANVIVNRSVEQNKTVKEICVADKQFSCWNRNDPNLEQIFTAFLGPSGYALKTIKQINYVCNGVYMQVIQDNTRGANHYLTMKLYNDVKCPKWARDDKAQMKAIIGNQMFIWCP